MDERAMRAEETAGTLNIEKDATTPPHDREPEPAGGGGRQPVDRLWDDDGFRQRVAAIAAERGFSVRDTVLGAGTSGDYLTKTAVGRNTNIVMRIAKFLQVDPAYLMFGPRDETAAGETADQAIPPRRLGGASPEQRLVLIMNALHGQVSQILLDPVGSKNLDQCLRQIEMILRR